MQLLENIKFLEEHSMKKSLSKAFAILMAILMIATMLAACADDADDAAPPADDAENGETAAPPPADPVPEAAPVEDLVDETIQFTILGIGGWVPSALPVEMSYMFVEHARENYGYDVEFSFADAPFEALFARAATSFAAGSNEYNLVISDSQWLGAFAEPGWIVQLNDIIDENPNLQVDWWSNDAASSYQIYPPGSGIKWGMPQAADVLIMYVRGDLMTDPDERDAFYAQYGWELPTSAAHDEWADIDFVKFENIAEFFTRPDEDLYGASFQYSMVYDFFSMSFYPFLWSAGGEIWDYSTHTIEGVLNTDRNAEMLMLHRHFMQFQPPGAINVDIGIQTDQFNAGLTATAWQWAAMGAAMDGPPGADVWAVILPGYRQEDGTVQRISSIGGQPWVINSNNTPEQMRVAIDFLNWWYTDEVQLEYARRGGNPLGYSVLTSPGFEDIQIWFPAYIYMMQDGMSNDFWHEPSFAEMLHIQQEVWTAFAAGPDGSFEAARAAMDEVAERQQAVLDAQAPSRFG